MVISDISIRRPVFAIVINLVVLLVGLISYQRLAVRLVPNVDVPIVTVNTSYPGASAQVIETQITKPIEDALSGIEGIDTRSRNIENLAEIQRTSLDYYATIRSLYQQRRQAEIRHEQSNLPNVSPMTGDGSEPAMSYSVAPPGAPPYKEEPAKSQKELLEKFDKNVKDARAAIAATHSSCINRGARLAVTLTLPWPPHSIRATAVASSPE